MRVSTSQIYSIANVSMHDAQVAINKTNEQISSGKRVLSPADDPVAATSILSLNQELSRTTQFNKNIDIADNNLSLEETTLQSVVSIVQRLRELTVSAGNTAVMTSADYKAIAAEIDSNMDALTNLQNTRNASGQYIFAGFQSATKPFVNDGGGNYSYMGDEGQLRLQAAATVTVAVSDSGKKLFMDIPAAQKTFTTSANAANKGSPAANISVGSVVDQDTFDKTFPNDMVVTFNANAAVSPPTPNYTITERMSGKVLAANQLYVPGQDIQVNGVKFAINGAPYTGTAATPGTVPAGAFAATDFSVTPATFDITVGGITETLTLDQNITTNAGPDSLNNLVTALGGGSQAFYDLPANVNTAAAANFRKLQNLGVTFTATGFSTPSGLNITVKNGTAATDAVTGMATQGAGTTSVDGVVAIPGDSFLIESTDKQSLLTTVARISDALKTVKDTPDSKAALAKTISDTLTNFSNAITNIVTVQGDVGARQNMLESSKSLNSDLELSGKEVLSQIQDLDYAEASTRLQMQSFVLSASQQSFVKVSQLSLFTYL